MTWWQPCIIGKQHKQLLYFWLEQDLNITKPTPSRFITEKKTIVSIMWCVLAWLNIIVCISIKCDAMRCDVISIFIGFRFPHFDLMNMWAYDFFICLQSTFIWIWVLIFFFPDKNKFIYLFTLLGVFFFSSPTFFV